MLDAEPESARDHGLTIVDAVVRAQAGQLGARQAQEPRKRISPDWPEHRARL